MVMQRENSNHHLNWSDVISCYNITIVSFCNNIVTIRNNNNYNNVFYSKIKINYYDFIWA